MKNINKRNSDLVLIYFVYWFMLHVQLILIIDEIKAQSLVFDFSQFLVK